MEDQLAIYHATLACHQAFRDLGAVPVLEEWAENRLADLNLWANGAGALKVGKSSLDSRLSSNLDAKVFVVNLLRMLQGFVEKCREIGGEVRNDTSGTSELSQATQDVNDIMGQLSRIIMSIRRASTNSRIKKADASYDPNHPQIKALSQHLQLLLLAKPHRNGTLQARASPQGIEVFSHQGDTTVIDSHSLTDIQKRLIEANLKRRNRFLYAQRHALKLSEGDQVPSTSIPAPQKLALPPALNDLKRTAEEHGVPKSYSATTATVIQDPIALPNHGGKQPATTVISAISSRVTYPRPPLLRSDQNVFQCPCCCQTLSSSMSRGSQWKKHLSRDILPYTCILEGCPHPEKLYQAKSLWLSHMFTDHGGISKWVCLACNHSSPRPVFYSESVFIEHLEGRHSSGIEPQQIPMLVSAWQRKMSASIFSCPLCGFEDQDSDALINHTAEHLHSFSLRSLPWAPGEGEPDGDLYDDYYEEHPYFNTGRSTGTESERSRSTVSSEPRNLEYLPAMGSGGQAMENKNNWLTEENMQNFSKSLNVEKDTLDAFLKGIKSQETFQESSPVTSVSNLGPVPEIQSKCDEADAVPRRDLERLEEVLGPEHPDTLASINKLGSELADQGEYGEAEIMYRRALEGYKKLFGPTDLNTLKLVNELGSVLEMLGEYEEAEVMYRRAVGGCNRLRGPIDLNTLKYVNDLGSVLKQRGRYEEAESMYRWALEGYEKALGPENYTTILSAAELGSVLEKRGKYREAEVMYRRALECYEKLFGPKHSTTLTYVTRLGSVLERQGKDEEAEIMHRWVLEGL